MPSDVRSFRTSSEAETGIRSVTELRRRAIRAPGRRATPPTADRPGSRPGRTDRPFPGTPPGRDRCARAPEPPPCPGARPSPAARPTATAGAPRSAPHHSSPHSAPTVLAEHAQEQEAQGVRERRPGPRWADLLPQPTRTAATLTGMSTPHPRPTARVYGSEPDDPQAGHDYVDLVGGPLDDLLLDVTGWSDHDRATPAPPSSPPTPTTGPARPRPYEPRPHDPHPARFQWTGDSPSPPPENHGGAMTKRTYEVVETFTTTGGPTTWCCSIDRPRPGRPRPASGQLRVKMEKAHGSLGRKPIYQGLHHVVSPTAPRPNQVGKG